MKKIYATLLIAVGIMNLSHAQIKTTGVVTLTGTDALKPITLKLDMNNFTKLITMTVTGPADRMFYIGFNGTTMSDGATDAIAITKLGACDQLAGTISSNVVTVTQPYIAPAGNAFLDTKGFTGHSATTKDAINDWTVISDDGDLSNPALTVRTVVATRKLISDNPTEDFNFDFNNLNNLNVIWATGRDFVPNTAAGVLTNPDSPDNGYWALSGKNTVGISTRHSGTPNGTTVLTSTRGTSSLTFTTTETKSTGVVTITPGDALKPITVKMDMDKTMGQVYMTITGPADRMFYLGFNGTDMSDGATDAVAITKLGACDQLAGTISSNVVTVTQPYIAPAGNAFLDTKGFTGHSATTKDAVNDWTVISDDGDLSNPALTTRTVVASRKLISDNPAEDYNFDYDNLSTLNVIWAMGRDFVPNTAAGVLTNPDSPDNGYWALSGKNTVGISTRHSGTPNGTTVLTSTRGTSILTFTTQGLDTEDFASTLENISIYPNPSTGIVNILNTDSFLVSKVRVFDFNAKLLQEINNDDKTDNISVNLSNYTKGMYFMEISNGRDKVVKKIVLK